mmetsp:Transcript_10152/g.24869  ORF Transcript_10152/g.24869 Transcript_10152/m.24869 type:complete len:90 (-) Transcript_10152:342-611(-)
MKIGRAKLVRECEGDPWAVGPFCNVITDVVRLNTPVPCRGHVSAWKVDDEVSEAVDTQLRQIVRIRDQIKHDLNDDGSSADEIEDEESP